MKGLVILHSIWVYTYIFLKNNGFYAVVAISQNFLRNENCSMKFKKTVISTNIEGLKIREYPYSM